MTRKLTLKRDVLQELSSDDLNLVVGGTRDTLFSCYTFVSCNILECLVDRATTLIDG